MKEKKIYIYSALIFIIILLIIFNVGKFGTQSSFEGVIKQPTFQELSSNVTILGEVEFNHYDQIYLNHELGDFEVLVQQGDIITLDTPLIKYSSDQIERELESVSIQIEKSYLTINSLEKTENRLIESGNSSGSKIYLGEIEQVQLDKRLANFDLRELFLKEKELEEQMKKLVVFSPQKGTVVAINQPNSDTNNPLPILEIASIDDYKLSGVLTEYESLQVSDAFPVTIRSDSLIEEEWIGEVEYESFIPEATLSADQRIPYYKLEINITEGDFSKLKPGFQMTMEIITEKKEVLTVPYSSITQEEELIYVYLLKDGILEKREVEIGMMEDESVEIIAGLSEKDQVVLEAQTALYDGMEVGSHD